jgi:sensor domain CHASE-containing protein
MIVAKTWTICSEHGTIPVAGSCELCNGDRNLIVVAPITELDDLKLEADKFRAVLKQIQEWDVLNPPQPDICCDFPWLKQLVDYALKKK